MTQEHYDFMVRMYEADRDEMARLTGDKLTTQAVYVSKVEELNKKAFGDPKDKAKSEKEKVAAYSRVMSEMGVVSAEMYDILRLQYQADRDEFIRITGDKETAQAEYIGKMKKLSESTDKAFAEETSKTKTFSDDMEKAITGWASGFSQTLSDAMWDADASFGSIAESFGKMITQMMIQKAVVEPMLNSMFGDGSAGSTGFMSGIGTWIGGLLGSAKGNIFTSPGLSAYSNSIVSSPTVFPFAAGMGLMGEAGPEAIIPLKRNSNGELGISGGGGGNVTVNVINNAEGTKATATQKNDGQGNRMIEVFIEQVKNAIAGDISQGAGAVPGALASTYGLNRVAGAW
jgi:hypothetical protein